jgi:hypothetical protein
VRSDVLNNRVTLYAKTWALHASKHTHDKTPATEEHIYQSIVDPDHAHRSLDPVIGPESCVFEKFFEPEQQRFFVPVIYDGVKEPGDYDQGGKRGRVTTGYFSGSQNISGSIGEIFWSKTKQIDESSK